MKDKSTVKKMRHAFFGSAILLIIAVIAYGIGCYPLYINAKSNVMHQLYDELKDIEISDMDDDDRESLNEYQNEKIDILIVDSNFREIYSNKGEMSKSYIRKRFQDRLKEYREEGEIDRRIYQSRQRLILKGKIVQEKNIYYAYLRKDVQSAYEIVHASVFYFSVAIAILILIQYLWYRKCSMEENNESDQADFQLQERQTEFVANVSHELKTPIAVVSSQIEMLELMGDKIDRTYYFSSIHEELDKMSKMVGELLDFSMLDNALNTMEISSADVSEMIEYLLLRYEGLFKQKGIRIEQKISPNAVVRGNQMYLERAVNNYLMNAMQHTGQGKKICVTVQKEKKYVTVNVFNEGEQIAENQLEHIWESFYTLARKKKGGDTQKMNAGLGLYMVKKIMEYHKGKCGVVNQANGVNFWLQIPIYEEKNKLQKEKNNAKQ